MNADFNDSLQSFAQVSEFLRACGEEAMKERDNGGDLDTLMGGQTLSDQEVDQ